MSKTRIFAISMIVLMLIAFFSNPKQEQHEKIVREKAVVLLKQQAGKQNEQVVDFGIQLFGNTLIDQFMQNHVKVENYYLFSLTKIRIGHEESTIGGGAFRIVWLSPKIDEKAAEIARMIKEGL
ncbi:DUF4359 domain-containing protein [Sphingobacterium sp. FBM7-1]|uniref:DUF4359 domain-containing protein n=1 Tax=Sphingobacterium sp. FBM7-1 TaxID=2886688 RepID=UPI001D0F6784|nr:DUF4359 domain-containing protein [Sphingobacterium sp. FBM7-1]MCC2599851.1 DUF4359 domain-containing protein [Sphingobacterium sp. FBM7-1]